MTGAARCPPITRWENWGGPPCTGPTVWALSPVAHRAALPPGFCSLPAFHPHLQQVVWTPCQINLSHSKLCLGVLLLGGS